MIITKDSHLDHGLTAAHLALLLKHFGNVEEFKIATIDIPLELPEVPCALRGPAAGDEPIHDVTYETRGDRKGPSRMTELGPKPSRRLTAVMGLHDGVCILYTAYGGPAAPCEPWDPILDDAGRSDSKAFWASHAIARGPNVIRSADQLRAGLASIRDELENADVVAHRDLDVPVSAMANGVHFARGVALRLVGAR